jgi:hypothetical protein
MFDAVGIEEDTMRFMYYKRLMPSAYYFILLSITLKPNPIEEIYITSASATLIPQKI